MGDLGLKEAGLGWFRPFGGDFAFFFPFLSWIPLGRFLFWRSLPFNLPLKATYSLNSKVWAHWQHQD